MTLSELDRLCERMQNALDNWPETVVVSYSIGDGTAKGYYHKDKRKWDRVKGDARGGRFGRTE